MRRRNVDNFIETEVEMSSPREESGDEVEVAGYLIPGSVNQRLTLYEEVVLIGLKDKQGYLSFMNDSISYVLRGCILIELALKGKIVVSKDALSLRKSYPDRQLLVVDSSPTGEVILDEALKMLPLEAHSFSGWMNLLSGETWNPLKIGFQLKNVRERIAKGLVDKGILRTEKQSFFFFDMATHPLVQNSAKADVMKRIITTCLGLGGIPNCRDISLVGACLTANIIENALSSISPSDRRKALMRAEDILATYSDLRSSTAAISPALEVMAAVFGVFSRLDTVI